MVFAIERKIEESLEQGIEGRVLRSARERSERRKEIVEVCARQEITLWEGTKIPYLREIPDPPLVLYSRGRFVVEESARVAVVGARRATEYGLRCALHFSHTLAEKGCTVVSGLARGVDTAAHRGAIKSGGKTWAVLGHGLDRIYPAENRGLAVQVLETGGALFSEYPPGVPPLPQHFPRRNRILSGLSQAVVVVQAALGSGSLITAHHALDQNRDVYVVPSRFDDVSFAGGHSLVQQGAQLLCHEEDLFRDSPLFFNAPRAEAIPRELQQLVVDNAGAFSLEDLKESAGEKWLEWLEVLESAVATGRCLELSPQRYVWVK